MRSFVVAASLVAGLAVSTQSAHAQSVPNLADFVCDVEITRAGQVLIEKGGMPLLSGDILRTPALSSALIRLPDGSLVKLRDLTKVEIVLTAHGWEVRLIEGQIAIDADSDPVPANIFRQGETYVLLSDVTAEAAYDLAGEELRFGVLEGRAIVNTRFGGADRALPVGDGQSVQILPFQEPLILGDFRIGQIAGLTQAQQAQQLVTGLGLESELPANATEEDAMDFLASLGLAPCGCGIGAELAEGLMRANRLPEGIQYRVGMTDDEAENALCGHPCLAKTGVWVAEKPMNAADLACILGLEPNVELATLIKNRDPAEQIKTILDKYPEIFWLQTRRRIPISPFAP